MNWFDGKIMCQMIAHTYANGCLPRGSIGETWCPRIERGKYWSKRRCVAVLDELIDLGYVGLYEGNTDHVVRTTEAGFEFFSLGGAPGISDEQADRIYGGRLAAA